MITEMGGKIKSKMCYAHIKGCQYCTYSIRDGQIFAVSGIQEALPATAGKLVCGRLPEQMGQH
jgi:ABC-type phosphonate transport system ATPase subunit